MNDRASAVCACRTGVRVVLAADDEPSRDWLSQTLRDDGHDVQLVASFDDVIESGDDPEDDHEIALVVVSSIVERAIGFVRALREVDLSSPAIVVAPTMSESERAEANRLGAVAFDGAIDLAVLRARVHNLGAVVSQRRVRWA